MPVCQERRQFLNWESKAHLMEREGCLCGVVQDEEKCQEIEKRNRLK